MYNYIQFKFLLQSGCGIKVLLYTFMHVESNIGLANVWSIWNAEILEGICLQKEASHCPDHF